MDIGKHGKRSIWLTALLGGVLVVAGLLFLRFELTIRADGIVIPESEHHYYAPDDVLVTRIHVAAGDSVSEGQVLFELDNEALESRRATLLQAHNEAQAELNRTVVALKEWHIRPAESAVITAAERAALQERLRTIQDDMVQMYERIREEQVISQLDLNLREMERIRTEIDLLESTTLAAWHEAGLPEIEHQRLQHELTYWEAKLALLTQEQEFVEERLERLTVRAPHDGILTALHVRHEGMTVPRGHLLARSANPEAGYRVRLHAPPRNIDLVQPGLPVLIESEVFDTVLEGAIDGRVLQLVPEADTSSGAARYEIEVAVRDAPYPLMFGSPVRARLLLGRRHLADVLIRSAGTGRRVKEQDTP